MSVLDDFDILMGMEPSINDVHTELCPEYPEYRVGIDGSVWSSSKNGSWFKLKYAVNKKTGRRYVTLRTTNKMYVSYLVLVTFVGPCPPGKEVCHENGDCSDDRKTNLRWDTHHNNMLDKIEHRTTPRGQDSALSKITDNDADAITARFKNGENANDLAEEYGIGVKYVRAIARGVRKKAHEIH